MKTREEMALEWVVGLLERLGAPFLVSGGLAARAYGSTRTLNDIDIEVPDEWVGRIAEAASDYLVWGPEREEAECFELLVAVLAYGGQTIEICGGDSLKMWDAEAKDWVLVASDFSRAERREVLGLEVPVMSRDELLAYKRLGGREVDLTDVAEISRAGSPG